MSALLLNPGPVTLSERVRQALLQPDLCHREAEFASLQARIRDDLLGVYCLPAGIWSAVLLTGSGTAAVEALLTSLLPRTGTVLVIENGVYGERMTRIAALHGIGHVRVTHPWGGALDLARIEQALEATPGITHVAVVHHETTTGRLNDLARLGALCRAGGLRLLVDAVSSFGGELIDFAGWGVSACAATANKCLHGVPGTAFVIAERAVLDACCEPARSLYLDLGAYARAQDGGSTPFTQSVHAFYALAAALAELAQEGGWQARRRRYAELQQIVRDGLGALGVTPLHAAAESSVVLSAYALPPAIDYRLLHDHLKERGFVIYAGQGDLAARIFRVSTMGALTDGDMHRFVDAVSALFKPG